MVDGLRTAVPQTAQTSHVHDDIYWTRNRVRIRAGETILTNGTNRIRARCGNCISIAPLLPTSDSEPDAMEMTTGSPPDQARINPLPPGPYPGGVGWPDAGNGLAPPDDDAPIEVFPLAPPQPMVVPEPGTLLLIGTGLAGVLARRVRARALWLPPSDTMQQCLAKSRSRST